MSDKLSLWFDDNGVFVHGDTYRHPAALWRAGYRYDHQRKRWFGAPGYDQSAIDKLNAKPKLGVTFKNKGLRWWLTGDTHLFRKTLQSWGGRWRPDTRTWYFNNDGADRQLKEFQEKFKEAHRLGELTIITTMERLEEYKRMLTANAIEIDIITRELLCRGGTEFWFPATVEKPLCACGLHLVWHHYCKNGKIVERTLANKPAPKCPGCSIKF